MIPSKFVKQPWEERNLQFDFTDALLTDDLINTVTGVYVIDSLGVDKTATMLGSTTLDVGRKKVVANIKGGDDGKYYWVRIRIATVSGDKIEDDLKLLVKQIGA